MRIVWSLLVFLLLSNPFSESPEPPLSDTRLTIHTLVREDIFAGWRADDMERLARGEKNIELLLTQRPDSKAELLAWKGGALLYRAVIAHEDDRKTDFEGYYKKAREAFKGASSLGPNSGGVAAVVGGSYAMFGDRLPERYRAAAWSDSYDHYKNLWKQQASVVDELPVHHRGELLAGVTQSAQRTGRKKEADEFLDRMLDKLKGTSYERTALKWKKNPQLAENSNLTCKSCHDPGRLARKIQ